MSPAELAATATVRRAELVELVASLLKVSAISGIDVMSARTADGVVHDAMALQEAIDRATAVRS